MIRWRPRQERVVLTCYTVALYMTVVDSTIIFTALPSLARDFHASLDAAQWVTLSYLLSLAVAVPSSGWIGDRFGTRRTFLIALVLFTGSSALCGLSGSLTQLVIFRLIQGIGGGLIIPVGQAMMFRTYPPERRARAQGMVALGTALGPATGPVLGGILTTELSWRWCFFVNIPFGTAALVIGLLFLAEHRSRLRAGWTSAASCWPAAAWRCSCTPSARRRCGAGPARSSSPPASSAWPRWPAWWCSSCG